MDVGKIHDRAAARGKEGRRGLADEERRLEVGADEIVPLGRVDLLETVHHFDLQHSGGHSVQILRNRRS